MKTYPALKEIKIMGIVMIAAGILVAISGLVPYLKGILAAVLIAYGLGHVFKLERFK